MAVEDFDPNMHQIKIDRDPVNGTFVGYSNSLTASTADPSWLIKRIPISGNFSEVSYAINPSTSRQGFFDNVWNDRVGLFGAPPFSNSKSIYTTGSSEHIIYSLNPAALQFTNVQALSISVWFKTFVTGTLCILGKQGALNSEGYRIELVSGELRFHLSGGAAGNRIQISSPLSTYNDGNWHHVVMTYAGDNSAANCKMVINGTAVAFTINNNTLVSTIATTVPFQISGRNSTVNNFNGFIDEVSVWRDNLTTIEAQEIYGTGEPTDINELSFNTGPSGLGGNLALWNRCGDNTTHPNYADLSGNGNTGIATNMSQANIVSEVP